MKVRDLSRDQRTEIVEYRNSGVRVAEIAHRIGCQRSNVSRTLTRRQQSGSNKDMPRLGRPCITLRADDKYLHMTARRSPKSTALMIQAIWHSKLYRWVSGQNLKNREPPSDKIVVFDGITRICIIVLSWHKLIFLSFCVLYVTCRWSERSYNRKQIWFSNYPYSYSYDE